MENDDTNGAGGGEVVDIGDAKKNRGRKKKDAGAAAKPAAKPRKPKQTRIPGTERHEVIPELERAAAAYVEVRDQRMALTKVEVERRGRVRELMKENKLTVYECDGEDLTIELIPATEEKVRVKRRDAEGGDDDDADGDG